MNLEKHAKALINYYSSSDDDNNEYDNQKQSKQYRNDFIETDEYILKLKQENLNNKQLITELLEQLEEHQNRIILLNQELLDQKKLAYDSQNQIQRVKVKKQQDTMLKQQKKFQDKFAFQTTDALEKLRLHFDSSMQLLTPKPNNK